MTGYEISVWFRMREALTNILNKQVENSGKTSASCKISSFTTGNDYAKIVDSNNVNLEEWLTNANIIDPVTRLPICQIDLNYQPVPIFKSDYFKIEVETRIRLECIIKFTTWFYLMATKFAIEALNK